MNDRDIIKMINDSYRADDKLYVNRKIPSYLEGMPRVVISEETGKNMNITFKSIDYVITKGR